MSASRGLWVKTLIAFLNVHTKEKQYPSLMYTIYANALITPLLALTLVYMWFVKSTFRTKPSNTKW